MQLISSGDSILMARAGCSGPIYPDWDDFVEKLEQAAKHKDSLFNENKDDFLVFANKVKKCLGSDRYYALLHNEFKPKKVTHYPYHETLCSLPFKVLPRQIMILF